MNLSPDIYEKLRANDRALGLPEGFTQAQFMAESGMRGDAVSKAGARGWAQVMPATQATLEERLGRKFDPSNIDDAIAMHRTVMQENLDKFGNVNDALKAYNGGWRRERWNNPETREYPFRVMKHLGGHKSDSQPQGMAAAYRSGSVRPTSHGVDDDIFVDAKQPAPTQDAGSAFSGASAAGIKTRPSTQGDDADIFADLPQSQSAPGKQRKQMPAVTWGERGLAVPAAVNKLATVMVGLPTDTVANVLDLGKAAAGYTTSKVTGKAPPEWTEPFDRSQHFGTSDWIGKQINDAAKANGAQSPIDIPRPDDQASRLLYGTTLFGASAAVPSARTTAGQQMTNAGISGSGGLLSTMVNDGLIPLIPRELAPAMAMVPQLAVNAGAAGIKRGIRGDEQGRKDMDQRMTDLRAGGVTEPSAGLASGNRFVMGVENLLSQNPFTSNLYQAAREKNMRGMQNKANDVRDNVSRAYGPVEAGQALQADIKGAFKDRVGNTYESLNNKFAASMSPDQRFSILNTLQSLDDATAINPLARATTAEFVQPRISNLRENILSDSTSRQLVPYGSVQQNIGLPMPAIKDIRTSIGKEAASKAIFGTPEQADFKRVYGGLSQDMRGAARTSDANVGPQPNNIGPSERALNRSNNYYSNAMNRADELNGLANRSTPEGAYGSVAGSLKAGPTVYERLRGVIKPETRQKIVATVIDELGTARAGQQNAAGDVWSPQTFLTNYNNIDPASRKALFTRLPGGAKHADDLQSIAKVADMVADGSKIWANPSGTAAALSARGTTFGVGALALYDPFLATATGAGLVLSHQASKRLLLNPQFTSWLARAPQVKPEQQQSYAQRLVANAQMSNDQQFKQDVLEYLESVSGK